MFAPAGMLRNRVPEWIRMGGRNQSESGAGLGRNLHVNGLENFTKLALFNEDDILPQEPIYYWLLLVAFSLHIA